VIQNAHAVRDGRYEQSPSGSAETGEVDDCVVVGGSFAGLSLDYSSPSKPVRHATASFSTMRESLVGSPNEMNSSLMAIASLRGKGIMPLRHALRTGVQTCIGVAARLAHA